MKNSIKDLILGDEPINTSVDINLPMRQIVTVIIIVVSAIVLTNIMLLAIREQN